MPGTPKIIVTRPGYDALTTMGKDLAFSSDYNLGKMARAIRVTNNTATAHGVPYTPRIMAMREVTSDKFGWGGVATVDGTNVTPTKASGDQATWVYTFIDPLVAGTYQKDMTGKPKILVGEDTGTDSGYKIHSGYDTFKVAKTGTLTIDAPIYDPGVGGGTKTTQATVDHNLGYIPMFAPFVEYEIEREAYLSWNGQYNSALWTSGVTYYTGQDVLNEDTSVWYTCKLTHTAAAANKPVTGASWATYWDVYVDPDFYDTYVNKLEDLKFIYGGVEAFNLSYIRYYATSTQLVLELSQYCYPDDPPAYDYTPCPAEKVTVDYTIFYNQANAEFNLL